jgi:hypothetical protein
MSALSIQPTYPIFTDIDGQPLEAGYVWLGQANLDPQVNPINVYWDAALSIPATQPIRTLGGYPARNGTPARLYVNSDYSIRVMNRNGSAVYSALAATERYNADVITSVNVTAADVVYVPVGVGVPDSNVQDKLEGFLNLKSDFGAVGDGVADDTNAFTLAMASNRTVYVPAGNYRMTGSVTIPTSTFTKFIGEANVPVPASKITVDFDGPAFVSNVGSTSFYCFENIFATVNNPATKTNTAFIKDDGDAVHCNFKGLVLQRFKQPGILLNAGFVCNFDHVLIQYCYNYGIKVNGGSDCRFVRVLADFTDGGGIDAFGGGFVFDNFYSENSCQRNDPATFNESWRDINLSGTNHTIIGGIIASYPQNNKAPIRLANSFNTSIIGLRGFSLGTGAPSYVQIDGSDGGLVIQQSEGLTVSGFKRNLITIQADGGAGSYPDILLGQDQTSLWAGSSRAWACFDGVTATLKQSSGIQSLTRNAAGDYTITFYTDTFANANYVVNANAFGSGVSLTTTVSAKLAGSVRFFLFNSVTGANVDSTDVMVAVNGF